MLTPLSPLDEAQFKVSVRQIIKEKGLQTALQMFYEMLMCAQYTSEVLVEEQKRLAQK